MTQFIQQIQAAIETLESICQRAEQINQINLTNFLKNLVAVRKANKSWIEKSELQSQLGFLEMLQADIAINNNLMALHQAVNSPANNPVQFAHKSKDDQVRKSAMKFVPTANQLIDQVTNILSNSMYSADIMDSNTYTLINRSLSNLTSVVKNNFNNPEDLKPLLQDAKQLTQFSMTKACMRYPNLTAFCGLMICVVGLSFILTGALICGLTAGAGLGVVLPLMLVGAGIIPIGVGMLKTVGFNIFNDRDFCGKNENKVLVSDYGQTLTNLVQDEKNTLKFEAAERAIFKATSNSSTVQMATRNNLR